MKKTIIMKRTLSILLALILSIGLFACNNASTTTTTTTQNLASPDSVGNFESYDQLKNYLSNYFDYTSDGYYLFRNSSWLSEEAVDSNGAVTTTTAVYNADTPSADQSTDGEVNHSETNNQVNGVSESDRILTDGYHIFVTSNQHFYIIDPDTLEIIYTYTLESGSFYGMFLNDDRVVLLTYVWSSIPVMREVPVYDEYPDATDPDSSGADGDATTTILPDDETTTTTVSENGETETTVSYYYYYTYTYGTQVDVVDFSDLEDIHVAKTLYFDSSYVADSRMIGDTVYLVMDNYAIYYGYYGDSFVPQYKDSTVGDDMLSLAASNIYYIPNDNYQFGYLLMVSFNVFDDEAANVKAYLGSTYQIYMSLNNLYSIIYRYWWDEEEDTYSQDTYILRFQVTEDGLVYQACGKVSGMPLNQFSMDEYDGVFRIATTKYEWSSMDWSSTVTNQLYLLDATSVDTMDEISTLGGLGKPGERIYAVRYSGEDAYVVTFVNTDPMYKLDLSDPQNPLIVGELYEEGVSDYLHEISDSLLLGIGRQAEMIDEWTRFTGVKVALYNVEGDDPVNIDQYLVEGEYSYTDVVWDHKAFVSYEPTGADFLYVAIPIYEWVYIYDENGYVIKYDYSQNEYIFKVYYSGDLEFVTKLSHYDPDSENYWYHYYDSIDRVVMIEDKIYTISYTKIQMWDMSNDFQLLGSTMLEENYYGYYWGVFEDGLAD